MNSQHLSNTHTDYECTNDCEPPATTSSVELLLSNHAGFIDMTAANVLQLSTENAITTVTSCNTSPTVVMTTDMSQTIHNSGDGASASESCVLLTSVPAESDSDHGDTIQADITRWEAFYDQIYEYLQHKTLPKRNANGIQKSAASYGLGSDGKLYYSKLSKDSSGVSTVLVVRNYEERLRICKEIHVSTGNEKYHNRRDKMLELIGKQYFWKGQRRDVCECIASCDVCSHGLGCKRKTKPPGQARDVRSPAKLSKLSTSPLTVHNSIASSVPTTLAQDSSKHSLSLLRQVNLRTLTDRTRFSTDILRMDSQRTASREFKNDSFDMQTTVDVLPVKQGTPTSAGASNPSSNSFQQIFTTINEPLIVSVGLTSSESSPGGNNNTHTVPSSGVTKSLTQTVGLSSSSSAPLSDQPMSDSSKNDDDSVYDLLFGLPSQPCDTLLTSVIEAMQMALKQTVDPVSLTKSCEAHMIQTLSLSADDHTVIIAPSRAAAYIIAVSASMLKIDPLSINHCIASRQGLPLAVLHDTCCHGNQDSGPLKTCTSLTGAYNWNLGDLASPMDRRMLGMAIRSNRVAAMLYQPYAYKTHCQHISLQEVSSSCHTLVDDVTVIVDGDAMRRQTRRQFVFTIKEFFTQGADVILLPDTENFQGPSQTCAMIGKAALLKQVSKNISLLQSQIAIPLICASHDLVGTVVTYKTFELTS